MRYPVAFLLFVSLLASVFPKGNQGYDKEKYEELESVIKDEFDSLDKNKDDHIDREEFRTRYDSASVEDAFKQFDVDGDGKMNYEECVEECLDIDYSDYPVMT